MIFLLKLAFLSPKDKFTIVHYIERIIFTFYGVNEMKKIIPIVPYDLKDAFPKPEKIASWEYCKKVNSYSELRKYIAELSCANKNYVLFFRGQSDDYLNLKSGKSSLLPTMYRSWGFILPNEEQQYRWKKLKIASNLLLENFGNKRHTEIRKKLIRWSILQHYEVTETPLIDVTQSLKVACSFAVLNTQNNIEKDGAKNNNENLSEDKYAYLYVLALPYYTNRISINSEEYLTNIRLISIAPPNALRPYYQEGFLVGEDEFNETYSRKDELDLNNRLVAKFKFKNNKKFWGNEKPLTQEELYPPAGQKGNQDQICDMCKEISNSLYTELAVPFNNFGIDTEKFKYYIKKWDDIGKLLNGIRSYEAQIKWEIKENKKKTDWNWNWSLNLKKTLQKVQGRRDGLAYNNEDKFKENNYTEKEWQQLKQTLTEHLQLVKNCYKEFPDSHWAH